MASNTFIPDERLNRLLSPEGAGEAVALLQRYFGTVDNPPNFTGGMFERFGGGGDRLESANRFTLEDVFAPTLLSTPVGARAALALLDDTEIFTNLLATLPVDVAFEDLSREDVADRNWAVRKAYRKVRALPGIGETRATKLLARKRPNLVPILDSVVRATLNRKRSAVWEPLHVWLSADEKANARRLRELGDRAGLQDISVIRIFDVLVWMVGSGHAQN